jgi:hypothetical protein
VDVSSLIVQELRQLAGELQQSFTGSDVRTAIKTVAALEFGVAVDRLPDPIIGLHDEATLNPIRIFAFDEVVKRLKE